MAGLPSVDSLATRSWRSLGPGRRVGVGLRIESGPVVDSMFGVSTEETVEQCELSQMSVIGMSSTEDVEVTADAREDEDLASHAVSSWSRRRWYVFAKRGHGLIVAGFFRNSPADFARCSREY